MKNYVRVGKTSVTGRRIKLSNINGVIRWDISENPESKAIINVR